MKKLFTIVLFLTGIYAFGQTMQSQSASRGPSVRLNIHTLYAFDDNYVSSYYSSTEYWEGKVKGGFQYGGGIEVLPIPTTGIEISYMRLDSKAVLTYPLGATAKDFDMASNYIFLGGNQYIKVNPKVEPFGGFLLGMGIYNVTNPDTQSSSSATKFAWGIKGGLNIWPNEKIGLKMQLGLISAVQAIGGGIYFGTGGGGAGVSGFSTYWQFNIGGGLVVRLK